MYRFILPRSSVDKYVSCVDSAAQTKALTWNQKREQERLQVGTFYSLLIKAPRVRDILKKIFKNLDIFLIWY